MTLQRRLGVAALAVVFGLGFWFVPDLRRAFVRDVVTEDAAPDAPVALPAPPADAAGLPRADHVRVVLIDGAGMTTARTMPAWNALCARGLDLVLDVGFPTVSLPVQVALWSGLTQQQTGILFHSGKPLAHPLGAAGIPGQVPDSRAVAEHHPEIIGSLSFAQAEPAVGPLPAGWAQVWVARALAAIASDARLAFVHVLDVDSVGHKHGRASPQWTRSAARADQVLGQLLAAGQTHPDALWVVLADHDHLAGGGHGGEERRLRQVRACIVGPGVVAARGGPIHLADLSRALADALGVKLPAAAIGRPLYGAIAAPLSGDDAVPALPLARGVLALVVIVVGFVLTAWGMQGKLARGPWWLPAAVLLLVVVRGTPTLSTPMIYKPTGRDMYLAFAPAFALLAVAAGLGLRRARDAADIGRAIAAQLALPLAALAALFTATGAWPILVGGDAAPIVPRWTAWTSASLLMVGQALGVVAIALLATAVLPASGRGARRETERSAPAAPG